MEKNKKFKRRKVTKTSVLRACDRIFDKENKIYEQVLKNKLKKMDDECLLFFDGTFYCKLFRLFLYK